MKNDVITIDVVSDIACPWCYVGKRRMEAALEQWKGAPVKVNWHPYQLDPAMQPEGMDRNTYLTSKFGSIDRAQEMTDQLTEAGKSVGIEFNFGDNWLAVNTLQMHKMLNVAREEGFDKEMKERFLAAYFEETKHLNQSEELYAIAKDFGWNTEKVDKIINDENLSEAVKAEIAHYQQRGVSGVPFFVINDKYGISGAQASNVFLEALQSISTESTETQGSCCGPEGC
ncbi:MAG: DsbA family oxidoreductase [Crocinitomicaceae bacterium]|nr:DsbA family oxidoreductase [Crocinitomicaceae bacterium]